jgi:signal transduction histidine kinase
MTRGGTVAYRRAVEEFGHRWEGPPWARHGRLGPLWARPDARRPVFVLPLMLAFVQVFGTFGGQHNHHGRQPLGVLLLIAGPAALLARRRHPLPTLAAVAAVSLLYLQLGFPWGPFVISLVVALLGAVVRGHRVGAWAVAVALYAGHLALPVARGQPVPPGQTLVTVAAVLGLVLVAGEVIRVTRERAAEVIRGQAEEQRRQVEERRRQASDERLRIARELHDVLAHNISLINVQAGVALHLMDDDPEQARTALTAIKQASKDTLRELRATLGMLRGVDEEVPRRPTPGLADLPELARQAGTTGLRVTVEVEGERRPLPAPVDLAAYRIVQEALTNVRKHAAAATATVHLSYSAAALTVRVDDDGTGGSASGSSGSGGRSGGGPVEPGPGSAESGGGNGIAGMRERAAALGGTLTAGPRSEGGFRVVARLPVAGGAPAGQDGGP